ncbi:hypothetical protein, partial [Paenibacillus sp. UASWS1643]|uniref:hypothetical protein n=1 Tax=Paenibacillus sp. UASWS1643 TaxID=2580422 RepID=UPI00123AA027
MKTHKPKIVAALTVCHGIYKKAIFVLNGQPVKINFLTMDEYREMVGNLSPARTHEWAGMLKRVDERKPIYYCIWTVKVTECHLITNKIQELIDAPAIEIIQRLLEQGAVIRAYDPIAT